MKTLESQGATIAYTAIGHDFMTSPAADQKPLVLWAHGWGQSHQSFLSLIQPFETKAHHIALDFPGFGASPPPPDIWGTENYADAIATAIKAQNLPPIIWIGHSFGCRVGLQIAARHPELIKQLCLIAGAGLKKKRPLHKKIYFYLRIKLFKGLKKFIPEGSFKTRLMQKFGSSDYKSAGPMRGVFIKVVNEDLTDISKTILCPTTLIYGENDTETPAEFGQRFSGLISKSDLHILPAQDHYSVLSTGRHQVIKIINSLIQ